MTEIIKKEIVTLPHVKEILESVKPDDMDQIQRWTADYVKKFARVDSQKAQTMTRQLIPVLLLVVLRYQSKEIWIA